MSTHIWYYMPSSLYTEVCIRAKLLQSCLTLWDTMNCCLPGFSVHGILQARILKWVAMPSSRGSFPPRDWNCISCSSCIAGRFFTTEPPGKPFYVAFQSLSHVWFFVTPWAAVRQASLSFTISLSFLMSSELVMPCDHLILWCPLLPPSIFPSIRVFPNESALLIRCPKYWSFSFRIIPSNEYSGLISFRIGRFDLLAFQGTLNSFFQCLYTEGYKNIIVMRFVVTVIIDINFKLQNKFPFCSNSVFFFKFLMLNIFIYIFCFLILYRISMAYHCNNPGNCMLVSPTGNHSLRIYVWVPYIYISYEWKESGWKMRYYN